MSDFDALFDDLPPAKRRCRRPQPETEKLTFSGEFSLPDRPVKPDLSFSGEFSLPDRPDKPDLSFGGEFSLPDRQDEDESLTFSGVFALPDRPDPNETVVSGDSGEIVNRPSETEVVVSGDSGEILNRPPTTSEVEAHLDGLVQRQTWSGSVTVSRPVGGWGGSGGVDITVGEVFGGEELSDLQGLLEEAGIEGVPSLDKMFNMTEKKAMMKRVLAALDEASRPWMNPDAPALTSSAVQFGMKDWDDAVFSGLAGVGTMGKLIEDIVKPLGGGKLMNLLDGLIPNRIKEKILDFIENGLAGAGLVDATKITTLVLAGIQFGRGHWDNALQNILTLGFGKVADAVMDKVKPLIMAKLAK